MPSLFDRFLGRKGRVPEEHRILLERAEHALAAKTSAHAGAWGLDRSRWAVDQDAGIIAFTRTDTGIVATAPVQIIGTLNTADGTWLWGWDHPSVRQPLQAHAERVRDHGARLGIETLTTHKIACTEAEAWQFAALACELNQAQGAYRGPAGSALVFMTFGNVTLSAAPGTTPPTEPAGPADGPE